MNLQKKKTFKFMIQLYLQHFILPGYYADVESRCQVFRVCAQTDLTGTGNMRFEISSKQIP